MHRLSDRRYNLCNRLLWTLFFTCHATNNVGLVIHIVGLWAIVSWTVAIVAAAGWRVSDTINDVINVTIASIN